MKKKLVLFMLIGTMATATLLSGCGDKKENEPAKKVESVKIDQNIKDMMKYIEDIDKLAVVENSENVNLETVLNDMAQNKDQIESIKVDDSKVDYTKAGKYPITITIKEVIPEGHTHDENSDHTEEDHIITGNVDIEIIDKDKVDEAIKGGFVIIGNDNKVVDKPSVDNKEDEIKDDDKNEGKDDKKPNKKDDVAKDDKAKKPSKPDSKPSKPSSKPESKPSKPDNKPAEHVHSWKPVYETVYHEEEGHYEKQMIEEAWDEEIWEIHDFCNVCGKDLTAAGERPSEHGLQHALAGEGAGGHYDKDVLVKTIHHDPIYKDVWVVDKAAWTEQKKTHEECSCGATR